PSHRVAGDGACQGAASVRGEAVEQAGAAGALQQLLAAAARAVGGVPRLHVARVLLQACAVVMADNGGAVRALGPVAAGGVATGGRVATLRVGAGEHVVLVGLLAAALHRLALLGERGLLGDVDLIGVQVGHILGDQRALGVVPRTLADAVAGI